MIGQMVTQHVASQLVEAFHYSVADFNKAQEEVWVELLFFVGREGHRMLDQSLAIQAEGETHSRLPRFVKGEFAENMNEGKTLAWFQYAAKSFPSSSWIFKLDTDVALNWTALKHYWLETTHNLTYMGAMNRFETCGGFSHCPPRGCRDMSGDCWVYMSGGFYGVTTQLAGILSECVWYNANSHDIEDLKFGRAVKECSKVLVNLVDVPRNESWCHSKTVNVTHIRNGWLPLTGDCM